MAIRHIVDRLEPLSIRDDRLKVTCHIGLTRGKVFAAEFGETQGRREFNVMGDKVNTAARLMHKAESNQILFSEDIFGALEDRFRISDLGEISLKGKSDTLPLFALEKSR